MKKTGSVLVIGLSLLVYACVFAQVEAPRGLIKGKVTDTQTPRPNNLANANVTVEGELLLGNEAVTVTTDSAGNYQIPNLPPGEYVVTVSKSGYDESMDYVTVAPGGESLHDVRLYKTDTVVTYFWKMGPVRWPLLLCSILLWLAIGVAIVYIILRIRRLVRSRSNIGEAFMSRVREALQRDDTPGAISICDEIGGLANILKAGLLRYAELSRKGEGAAEDTVKQAVWKENIQEAMEKAGVKAKKELKFHWSLIVAMFAAIGVMVLLYGLVGTAAGAVKANTAIALRGTGDIQLLAAGLAEASLASMVGLMTAIHSANLCIVVFIIYVIFEKKVDSLISRTQRTCAKMVNSLFTT